MEMGIHERPLLSNSVLIFILEDTKHTNGNQIYKVLCYFDEKDSEFTRVLVQKGTMTQSVQRYFRNLSLLEIKSLLVSEGIIEHGYVFVASSCTP
jgi:hypothetical protein